VLGAWSLLFAWLLISGEVARYLGPRTFWVAAFGAIGLTVVTLLYGAGNAGSADAGRTLSAREAGGLLALMAPVLIAFLMANASLGSLAASRKLTSRGIDVNRLEEVLAGDSSELGFLELNVAGRRPDFARENGIVPGRPVDLTGLVLDPSEAGPRSFQLGRFYITCCVADSIPVGVEVDPDGASPAVTSDEWLEVTGQVAKRRGEIVVEAMRVSPVDEPDDPYLTFTY
jgi:putative membrane protein